MGIGKGKSDSIDLDGLMGHIDNENKVTQEESRLSEKIVEQQQATADFNATIDRMESIVTSFNNTLEEVRTNGIGASVHPRTVKSLSEICTNFVVDVGKQLMEHRDKQLEQQKEHEERMARMLAKNKGIWLSDRWAKVLAAFFLFYVVVSFVYILCKVQ